MLVAGGQEFQGDWKVQEVQLVQEVVWKVQEVCEVR